MSPWYDRRGWLGVKQHLSIYLSRFVLLFVLLALLLLLLLLLLMLLLLLLLLIFLVIVVFSATFNVIDPIMSVYMSVCLSVCLSIYLSVCLSACLPAWLCVCVSVCVSSARDSSETIEVVIVKLGTVTASGMLMHQLYWSWPSFKVTQILIMKIINVDYFRNLWSNGHQFLCVKIVRLKVYMIVASPMTLTFIQARKCVSNLTTF